MTASPQDQAALAEGAALLKAGRAREALPLLQGVLDRDPAAVRPRLLLAEALFRLGRYDAALAVCDAGLAQASGDPGLLDAKGNALVRLWRFDEAAAAFAAVAARLPNDPMRHSNLGVSLRQAGRPEQAIKAFDRAIALDPTLNGVQVNRAICELELGRFETGWAAYERRLDRATVFGRSGFSRPAWTGETSPAGRRILVHAEFGLGDTIQFCRYVPMLEAAGARVLLAPQPALRTLMRSLSPTVEIVDVTDPALAFDLQVRTMSLPYAFGTRLDSIPVTVPYLAADPARVATWRERLGEGGLKVGVCWRGSRTGDQKGLSFAADDILPLAAIPGVRLVSLQKSGDPAELATIGALAAIETPLDPADLSQDGFNDTAALVAACDLVVSCDTAIAHLAGALGKPTWIVMPVEGDWRWLRGRADSPWYPTARLFRPSLLGGRAGVFAALEAALRERVAS